MRNIGRMNLTHVAAAYWAAYQVILDAMGGLPAPPWLAADNSKREQLVNGVIFHTENPNAAPADSHEHWRKYMEARGYQYGDEFNVKEKTHPAMIPFDQLPPEIKITHHLFAAVCKALIPFAKRDTRGLR